MESFGQAWWSRVTIGILTPKYLFGHMRTYFLLSLHTGPAVTVVYLSCFLICLLAKKKKKFLQPSIITMTVIIIFVSTIISTLTVNQILIYSVY